MRNRFHDLAEKGRHRTGMFGTSPGDRVGHFTLKCPVTGVYLFVVACDGDRSDFPAELGLPFDHVSVSVRGPDDRAPVRCPTWEEMCWVKGLFWGEEECVVQYHPPKSRYVNRHPFVLHLWKPVGVEMPMPALAAV